MWSCARALCVVEFKTSATKIRKFHADRPAVRVDSIESAKKQDTVKVAPPVPDKPAKWKERKQADYIDVLPDNEYIDVLPHTGDTESVSEQVPATELKPRESEADDVEYIEVLPSSAPPAVSTAHAAAESTDTTGSSSSMTS